MELKIPAQLYDALSSLRVQHMTSRNFETLSISPSAIQVVIASASPLVALYLTLLWRTAHRSTSVCGIMRKDVFINLHHQIAEKNHLPVTFRFRTGKTQKATDVYAVTILMQLSEIQLLQSLLTVSRPDPFLFPHRHRVALACSHFLRQHGYDIRSIRRGALRFLASKGVSLQQLCLLGRHTTEKALYQYLGGGALVLQEASQQSELSRFLLPSNDVQSFAM